jgi:hypothetical protein
MRYERAGDVFVHRTTGEVWCGDNGTLHHVSDALAIIVAQLQPKGGAQ